VKSSSIQRPLADLARPTTLSDFIGYSKTLGPSTLLHTLISNKKTPSLLFWGPPGSGI